MQDKATASPATGSIIGTRPVRPDGMDKVTGRARFGADYSLPGQLVGKILRSPHPHARLLKIDTTEAMKLDGVKAIVTRNDFPDLPSATSNFGEGTINFYDVTRTVMAREKVLFEGHPVAAIAATSEAVARRALKLIKVDYEVLPFVIDVDDAMAIDHLMMLKMADAGADQTVAAAEAVASHGLIDAPGTAAYSTAAAHIATLQSNAHMQKMIASALRQEAALLGHDTMSVKR